MITHTPPRKPLFFIFLTSLIIFIYMFYLVTGTTNVTAQSCTLDDTVRINFQTNSSSTPTGFFADDGSVYGLRDNGCTYGWDGDNTANARDRDWSEAPVEQQYDTLNHMQLYGNFTWEIEVPNGDYLVHLVAGDPNWYDTIAKINIEDTLVVDGTPDVLQRWIYGSAVVSVSDGRLTLANADGAANNKPAFIELPPVTFVDEEGEPFEYSAKINFQDNTATTPLGYLADTGEAYGNRGGGFSYGWDSDNTANARNRNSVHAIDERYDTLNHMQLNGDFSWELEVDNGVYAVYMVVGDPSYRVDHDYKIFVEGNDAFTDMPLNIRYHLSTVAIVSVGDGLLTISNDPTAVKNRINFIEITRVEVATLEPTPTPVATDTPEGGGGRDLTPTPTPLETNTPTITATTPPDASPTPTATTNTGREDTPTPGPTDTPAPTSTPSDNTPIPTDTPSPTATLNTGR